MRRFFYIIQYTPSTALRTLLLLLCVLSFFSCERRELTYDTQEGVPVNISIDWSALKADEEKPLHIKALFYPTDGGKPIERYLMNSDGEKVYVPEGEYNIIVYNWRTNGESQTIQFRGHEEYLTHEAYTAEASRRKQTTKQSSDPIIAQPDYTYSWSTGKTPVRVGFARSGDISIVPRVENQVRYYQFTVDIYNPDEISSIEGVIEGTHGWIRLATGERSSNSYSTDLTITRMAGENKEKAKFLLTVRTFGVMNRLSNNITIETTNSDNLKETFTKDVGDIIDQINKGTLDNSKPIDISDPEIPIVITPGKKPEGGGFKPPVVDDWDDTHGGDINI